jgi:hypothetical protein
MGYSLHYWDQEEVGDREAVIGVGDRQVAASRDSWNIAAAALLTVTLL